MTLCLAALACAAYALLGVFLGAQSATPPVLRTTRFSAEGTAKKISPGLETVQ